MIFQIVKLVNLRQVIVRVDAELNESQKAVHLIKLPWNIRRLILGSWTRSVVGVAATVDAPRLIGIVAASVTERSGVVSRGYMCLTYDDRAGLAATSEGEASRAFFSLARTP